MNSLGSEKLHFWKSGYSTRSLLIAVARRGAFSLALVNHVASLLLWQKGHVAHAPHAGKVGPVQGMVIKILLHLHCIPSTGMSLFACLLDTVLTLRSLGIDPVMGSTAVLILGDPCWDSTALRTCVPQSSFLQAPSKPWLLVPASGMLSHSGKLPAPTFLGTRLGAKLRHFDVPGKVMITHV